ncbi:hypothetical protein HON52_00470 [Candidatus Uhrbacteria bacterium]|jgi:hypothetical protein|nr:hypothetical protein [Candidatus Uhrbacteria bacterium]
MKRIWAYIVSLSVLFIPLMSHAQVTITNPLGEADPRIIVARVIQGALSVSGTLALLMFIYAGMLWMTARGESAQVDKGKKIMVWAVLGIIVIASSYIITTAIFNALSTGSVDG